MAVRELDDPEQDQLDDEEREAALREKSAELTQVWEECKLFEQDSFGTFMLRVLDLRNRMVAGLTSTRVDISLVPTLRGQLKAFELVLEMPDRIRETRDRLIADVAQLTGPDEQEE